MWLFLLDDTIQALNTFIDDLFAFVIKMPTMHRLAVFRDGVAVHLVCRLTHASQTLSSSSISTSAICILWTPTARTSTACLVLTRLAPARGLCLFVWTLTTLTLSYTGQIPSASASAQLRSMVRHE